MWKMNNGLIQVEAGANVIKKYTQRDNRGIFELILGSKPPSEGGLLCVQAEQLRQELDKQNIYLPSIYFTDSADLSPNQFVIYVGITNTCGDITSHDLFKTLKNMIVQNQIDNPSEQAVKDLFMKGVEYYHAQDYNKAVNIFSIVYYWATILGCMDELVNATINVGTILFFNNRIDDALMYAKYAALIAENPSFYNVSLKFNSHNFLANMYWLNGNKALAMENYQKAVDDVQNSGKLPVKVFALWNAANAYMWTGNYSLSASLLDKIFVMVCDNEQFTKETVQKLYELRVMVSNLHVTQLLEENSELSRQVQALAGSFDVISLDSTVQFVKRTGDIFIKFFGGYLLGTLNHMEINNHSKNTTSIKIENC